ncbi:MAG: hypothetical protein ACRDOK_30335, partial [Streptosporangiaceae bacterium]
GAAARTVAAGSARVSAAWCSGTPVPEAVDRRSDGVADLGARRARVLAVPFLTERFTGVFSTPGDEQPDDPGDAAREEVYDGAACYLRVGDAWTIFFGLVDPSGPRGPNDPLWPLDALFGARDDGIVVGTEDVRGESATRYRLSIDLGLADARLSAGVTVHSGPYRALSRLPAEVWLDSAGLARRIAVTSDPADTPDRQVWAVVELWDFGLPVEINPPDRDDVVAPSCAYDRAYGDTADAPSSD